MAEPVPPTNCDEELGTEPGCKRIRLCQNQLTPGDLKQQVFSNELIIEQILKHLPFESALNFRLLSTAWCKKANKNIKADRRMLRFDLAPPAEPGEDNGSRYFQVIRKENAKEFTDVALRSSPKIFTRFSFLGNQLNSAPIASFLEAYGSFIVEAEIEWREGSDFGLLSVFREVLFFALPNLSILHLKNVPASWQPATTTLANMFPPYLTTQMQFNPTILQRLVEVNLDLLKYALLETSLEDLEESSRGINASYHLLRDILEIAPNIEKIPCLQLVLVPRFDMTGITSLRTEISNISRMKDKSIVKGMKLLKWTALYFLQRNISFTRGIFLESIHLNASYYSNYDSMDEISYVTAFEKILDDQKSSLKSLYLQLKCVPAGDPASLVAGRKFIKLPKLDRLVEITIYLSTRKYVIPSADSLGDNLPNLRTISLLGGPKGFRLDDGEIHALRSQGGINRNVRELNLTGTVHTPSFLEWLVDLFPKVKHLTVTELNENVYPTLWGSWPEMEIFRVQNTTNLKDVDSVFTGMSAKMCQKVLSELTRSVAEDLPGKENNFWLWYSDLVGINPNMAPAITRWKKLRKLYINHTNEELEPEDENSSNYISDTTGCMAFSKMENLQYLVVRYCKISTYCRKVLQSQMNYVYILDE